MYLHWAAKVHAGFARRLGDVKAVERWERERPVLRVVQAGQEAQRVTGLRTALLTPRIDQCVSESVGDNWKLPGLCPASTKAFLTGRRTALLTPRIDQCVSESGLGGRLGTL